MIYTLWVFYYHGFQCLINSYFDGTICSLSQYSWRYSINKISILANHACIFPLQIPTSMSLFWLIWVCQTIKETFKDYRVCLVAMIHAVTYMLHNNSWIYLPYPEHIQIHKNLPRIQSCESLLPKYSQHGMGHPPVS